MTDFMICFISGLYFAVSMVLVNMALLQTVFVVNLYYRGNDGRRAPRFHLFSVFSFFLTQDDTAFHISTTFSLMIRQNFELAQNESICILENICYSKIQICYEKGIKHCGVKEKMLATSIFYFSLNVLK